MLLDAAQAAGAQVGHVRCDNQGALREEEQGSCEEEEAEGKHSEEKDHRPAH